MSFEHETENYKKENYKKESDETIASFDAPPRDRQASK